MTDAEEPGPPAGEYIEQPFLGLLTDAIVLCELSEQLRRTGLGRHGTLARAAVTTGAFCIEASANALLGPVEAPEFLRNLADRLPIVEKFAFILFAVRPDGELDRGTKHVQEIRELFEVRDQLVHARARSRVVTHKDLGDGTIQISKTAPPTNHLRLPRSPEDWRASHAVRVLRAVSDFLDFFVLDLCEVKREEAAAILLSRVTIGGSERIVLPGRQRAILDRAIRRWPIDFRLIRLLLTREGAGDSQQKETLEVEARFSWGAGPVQLHDNRLSIEVDAPAVSSAVVSEAVMKFFTWFEEAQALPFGRSLVYFELWTEKEGRLVEYRTFLPDLPNAAGPAAEERPMGVVAGVATHFFANAIVEVRRPDDVLLVTFVLEDGSGRAVTFPAGEASALVQLIAMNRRSTWEPNDLPTPGPIVVHEKGRDYVVREVEIFAYDPTSRTAFLTYRAETGRTVQVNMSTATAARLFIELGRGLSRGAGGEPERP